MPIQIMSKQKQNEVLEEKEILKMPEEYPTDEEKESLSHFSIHSSN